MEAASMTWPPAHPEQPVVRHRPWDPKHPQAKELVNEYDRLVYFVIDEIVEDWVDLSISLWPHADAYGRLRFLDPKGAVDLGTTRKQLRRFLGYRNRRSRELRVGQSFASRVKDGTAAELVEKLRRQSEHGQDTTDLGQLLERPVDLTKQARMLARLASYGALLSTLPAELEDRWNLQEELET
jgi:hypothetical protein